MVPNKIRQWHRWLDRIFQEQIADIDDAQHVLRELDACLQRAGTPSVFGLGYELQWGMIMRLALAIRRSVEGGEDRNVCKNRGKSYKKIARASLSLVLLLRDVNDHAALLTRDRFRRIRRAKKPRDAVCRREFDRRINMEFDSLVGSRKSSAFTASQVQSDIRALNRMATRARHFVNRRIAHTRRDRRTIPKTRCKDLDAPAAMIQEMFGKYDTLIRGRNRMGAGIVQSPRIRQDLERLYPPASRASDDAS